MARLSLTPFRETSPAGRAFSDPFLMLHREMNRLFDDAFHGVGFGGMGGQLQSAGFGHMVNASMNVSENDHEICVTAELPGVSEQDVEVTLDDDVLTISGEKKFEQSRGGEKENYHFIECSYGSFQRSIQLPHSVDPDQVRASFDKGVLTVVVPKNAQQERSRKIRIQSQTSGSRPSIGEGNGGQRQAEAGIAAGTQSSQAAEPGMAAQTRAEGRMAGEGRSTSGGGS